MRTYRYQPNPSNELRHANRLVDIDLRRIATFFLWFAPPARLIAILEVKHPQLHIIFTDSQRLLLVQRLSVIQDWETNRMLRVSVVEDVELSRDGLELAVGHLVAPET